MFVKNGTLYLLPTVGAGVRTKKGFFFVFLFYIFHHKVVKITNQCMHEMRQGRQRT